MLELGKAGSAGTEKGVLPVLRGGAVVATVQPARWREAATVTVGGRTWEYAKNGRELVARRSGDPEGTARLRARQVSGWKGTHRFLMHGMQVAESGTTPGWTPRATITIDGSLPPDQQVFLLWWEHVVRRRAAAAAA